MTRKNTLIIFAGFIFSTGLVFAADYVPLEPGAFTGVKTDTGGNLGVFLGQVFNWAIAIAVASALVMIIWGGIEYMTTDSWSGKNDGRTKIQNALLGLGLALISWLLLYTINPELVNFQNNQLINPSGTSSQSAINGVSGANNGAGTNSSGVIGNFSYPSGNTAGASSNSGGSVSNTAPCDNCVDITGQLAIKSGIPGYELNQELASKLEDALAGQPVQVTDAYPPDPTISRSSDNCHNNGTCADVNFTNQSTSVNDVRNLYDRLVSEGLNPSYEVVDISSCQKYKDIAGLVCTSYTSTTNSHFHVSI